MKHSTQIHLLAAHIFAEMREAERLLALPGSPAQDVSIVRDDESPYIAKLDELYAEGYALARLRDDADLLVHAEGPAAADHAPKLDVVTWLFNGVEKHLRALAQAALEAVDLSRNDARRQLDLRLSGMAPGSLWAGFKMQIPEAPLLEEEDRAAMETVRRAVRALPVVARHVTDTEVRKEIADELPDPALRDASLMAAYALAPTGRRGVHTLELDARGAQGDFARGVLDVRDRVVLAETVRKNPMMRNTRTGALVGEIREVDLDANRFKLRTDSGVVRCAYTLKLSDARRFLGSGAKVYGTYESDRSGRPRLMRAERIESYQHQGDLLAE
ncbi:MAG: hypothetical protein KJ011_05205 [Burkholderiaceae bacterium]|nr:hypothetical protein [Burkholderiaceae bacterium]